MDIEMDNAVDNAVDTDTEVDFSELIMALQAQTQELRSELDRLVSERRFIGALPGESGAPELLDAGVSYEERLRTARADGDTLEAIRVKQEAAREGVILI